jgi:hypothetical protein
VDTGPKRSDSSYSDRSEAWLPGQSLQNRTLPRVPVRPECPDGTSANDPAAFKAHSPAVRGGGLAQHVFPSPARIPTAEPSAVRPTRRAAKRKTLYVTF